PSPSCPHTLSLHDALPISLLALDLEVGEHRLAARAPVDDVVVAVDQSLVVQAHEHLAHGARQPLVHGEAQARPVAGGTELLELTDRKSTRLNSSHGSISYA